jgi:hypothetical protein
VKVPSVSSREYTDMSTDHRKPVVAFVCLAFIAAALIGVQRADAQAGRFLEAFVGSGVRVHSDTLLTGEVRRLEGGKRLAGLGPGFEVLAELSPGAGPARTEKPGEPRTKRGRAGEVNRGASGKRPELKADGSRHGRDSQRADRLSENHVATAVRTARQAARDARGAARDLAEDARGPEHRGAAARGLGRAVSEAARGLRNRPGWRGRRP